MALTITATGGLALFAGVLVIGHIVGSYDLDVVLAAGDHIRGHPLYLPALVAQFNTPAPGEVPADWVVWIQNTLVAGDHPLYITLYFALIVFFTYFYVAITFNPDEVSDNMKKYGGFIPGIRAGKPTENYLAFVLSRLTLPGALYLGLIALLPSVAFIFLNANQNFPFGGTAVLIMVGVGLDTVKQIETQLMQRNYEGFLR